MTSECKKQFTLRITQANKTELIVILYEMILCYLGEAEEEHFMQRFEDYRNTLRKVRGCINELLGSLNMEYEPAAQLLQLYLYCNRELVRADIKKDTEYLAHIRLVVGKLQAAYAELAQKDESGPVMQNSQTIYAGLTYGRKELTENMADQGSDRGFRA